ncbi:MAG: hypothetical protein ACRDY0_08310 [Acidimicrobiales bacterium]
MGALAGGRSGQVDLHGPDVTEDVSGIVAGIYENERAQPHGVDPNGVGRGRSARTRTRGEQDVSDDLVGGHTPGTVAHPFGETDGAPGEATPLFYTPSRAQWWMLARSASIGAEQIPPG